MGRVRVPLRRAVLRGASIQRQARVLVRLPRARRAGDPPQQSRRGVAEDTQDMSPAVAAAAAAARSLCLRPRRATRLTRRRAIATRHLTRHARSQTQTRARLN